MGYLSGDIFFFLCIIHLFQTDPPSFCSFSIFKRGTIATRVTITSISVNSVLLQSVFSFVWQQFSKFSTTAHTLWVLSFIKGRFHPKTKILLKVPHPQFVPKLYRFSSYKRSQWNSMGSNVVLTQLFLFLFRRTKKVIQKMTECLILGGLSL